MSEPTPAQYRELAADYAERALMRERAAGREPAHESWAAVAAAREHARGKIKDAALAAANDAARDAAWPAACRFALAATWVDEKELNAKMASWAAACAAAVAAASYYEWAEGCAAAWANVRAAVGAAGSPAKQRAAVSAERQWQADRRAARLRGDVLPPVSP